MSSDKQHIESVAKELYSSKSWAYNWYKRYGDEGFLEGLRDRPRSGKPPAISTEIMEKIKQELSGSGPGWDFRQVIEFIQKKTGVSSHKVHIYRLLHRWGFVIQGTLEEICKNSIPKGEKAILKKGKIRP